MAADPPTIQHSTGVPVATYCRLENHTDDSVNLESESYWHGYGQTPKSITKKEEVEFKHNADALGSIGGLCYILEDKNIKWIVAWSNAEDQPHKVYTEILEAKATINWADIKANLNNSKNQCSFVNGRGYISEVVIEAIGSTPKMTVKLRPEPTPNDGNDDEIDTQTTDHLKRASICAPIKTTCHVM